MYSVILPKSPKFSILIILANAIGTDDVKKYTPACFMALHITLHILHITSFYRKLL